MRSLTLHTNDGHELAADLVEVDHPVGAVVVCHPHPLHGGNRYNNVVEALFTALPRAGFTAIRFDFRRAHDKGVGERLDVASALDALDALDGDDVPAFVAGYSFGAVVALSTVDTRVAGIVAVAPPLTTQSLSPAVPCLVLSADDDQFCPAATAAPIVGTWLRADFEVVASADHFLAGHTAVVAERSVAWLSARV